MELSEYYVSCTGSICKTVRQELYGVLMAPRLYIVNGLIGKDYEFGSEMWFQLTEIK